MDIINESNRNHILKKLFETIEFIENGKRVHITKLTSINRLSRLFDYCDREIFFEFTKFIANNILFYFENEKSLCKESLVPYEEKLTILKTSVLLINNCFKNGTFEIEEKDKLESIYNKIRAMSKIERLYVHATRFTLNDADLLAMQMCLRIFINANGRYPYQWNREYEMVKYYCVPYSDMRFRLEAHSIPRINDIIMFVDAYIKKNTRI